MNRSRDRSPMGSARTPSTLKIIAATPIPDFFSACPTMERTSPTIATSAEIQFRMEGQNYNSGYEPQQGQEPNGQQPVYQQPAYGQPAYNQPQYARYLTIA